MAVVRILRVLEYVGELETLDAHLAQCFVKGSVRVGHGDGRILIREAILGQLPELFFKTALDRALEVGL